MNNNFFKKIKTFFTESKINSEEKLLLEKIASGMKNKEFKMHLQFIVDTKTKEIISAEALSRWETSEGELVMPGKYIGVLEKSGMITDFDYYMFERVCEKLAAWEKTDSFKNISISCNITRITMSEKDFVGKINDIAAKYEFDKSKLMIEITEDSIEKNLVAAMNNIKKAKESGFTIALDDIGSGYTSFSNLCEYPVDIVKIDREILLLTSDESGKKLFMGIVALIHSLNLKAVCEGVETEEQNALVFDSGCDYIQGWYYSRALPEDKAEEFYKEYMKKF